MTRRNLVYGSLFSGIGGFDLGFARAGIQPIWMCEKDRSCQSVSKRHWPEIPIYDDITQLQPENLVRPDILTGGFPCQDVSVAGRRAGLAGERSGLWYEFHRIIDVAKPRIVVIENVPGLLSSHGGRDFAAVIRGLVECGYGVAWRILDAQYFGVPQRRRRVFIVGSLGDGRAAEILFEREGCGGDFAPGREARPVVASPVASGAPSHRNGGSAPAPGHFVTHSLTANGHDASEDGTGRGTPIVVGTLTPGAHPGGFNGNDADRGMLAVATTLNSAGNSGGFRTEPGEHLIAAPLQASGHGVKEDGSNRQTLVFDWQSGGDVRHNVSDRLTSALQTNQTPAIMALHYSHDFNQDRIYDPAGIAPAHNASDSNRARNIALPTGVRRLTPTECERLQGFPDGWTAYGADGPQSDSARYRQLGNAVAVPVAEWLGRRIVAAMESDR